MFILICLFSLAGCVTTGPTIDKSKMAEGYYMKGLSYLQERNLEMASVEFHRSIQTDSNNKHAYYGLGLISDAQGKLDEAIKYYKEVISLDSDYSEAYNALGSVYSKKQKWPEAIKFYKKALENKLYTTPHMPNMNMGAAYMEMKEYDKAVESYREAKRYVYQDYIILQLGLALYESGKIKEAISEFQEGIVLAPQNATMRYHLALALLKSGNKKLALAEFKKAAEIVPKTDITTKANDYIKTLR